MPRTFGRASVYHLAFRTMTWSAFVFVARMNRRHLRMESEIGGKRKDKGHFSWLFVGGEPAALGREEKNDSDMP